jgi:hypothetical protein
MSRPSSAESEQLERLEAASALLANVSQAAGILAVRLRQILHRLPARYRDLALGAGEELTRVVDACDRAHELLGEELAVLQDRRSRKHAGE